jgi:hypothetical protein
MRLTDVALLAMVLTAVDTAPIGAQKGKPVPKVTGGPSDAVFGDLDGVDRIRSDGYVTDLCNPNHPDGAPAGEASRYCGGTFTDPDTNLTYEGVGPECSRISYGSNGEYSFRTISSKCETYPPLPDGVVQRRVILDFGGWINAARCQDNDPSNDWVSPQVEPGTKPLNVCAENLVDDVRIVAGGMFTAASATITIYISLVGPPDANTTQFLLEFTSPAQVSDNASYRELVYSGTAVLWEMVRRRNGSVQKAPTAIGEYAMPFSLRARKAPM